MQHSAGTLVATGEPLIYREEVTAVLIALSDIVAVLRDIRGGLFGEEEEEE